MSERFGKCNFCNGTGERHTVIEGTRTDEPIELSPESKANLEATGIRNWRRAMKTTFMQFTRECGMCQGTGFSGSAEEYRW